jgi:cob(I)alamin adenosyltransferase
MSDRIKNGVCYGSGDNLTSYLISGKRLYKDSSACDVYSDVEKFKNQASWILCYPESKKLQYEDKYILTWFRDAIHSLGSYCFLWGETEHHVFPIEVLEALEIRLAYFQSFTNDCKDFLIQEELFFLELDSLRIVIRDLERSFVRWYRTLYGEKELDGSRKTTAAILNRLSGYLFNLTRFYAKEWGVTENHWHGSVQSFDLYRKE